MRNYLYCITVSSLQRAVLYRQKWLLVAQLITRQYLNVFMVLESLMFEFNSLGESNAYVNV